MSERTRLIIEAVVDTSHWEGDKLIKSSQTCVATYENKFGFGVMQLLDVMRFLTQPYDGFAGRMKWEEIFPKQLHKARELNPIESFAGEVTVENVEKYLNDTKILDSGGLLLRVKMNSWRHVTEGILYLFNDPLAEWTHSSGRDDDDVDDEDEDAVEVANVNRYVNLMDYIAFNHKYFEPSIITAFTALLEYHGVGIANPNVNINAI